jgi:hypothetical protein
MVQSAGVTDQTLIAKTVSDAAAMVKSSGMTSGDLTTLANDHAAIKKDLGASLPVGATDGQTSVGAGTGYFLSGLGGQGGGFVGHGFNGGSSFGGPMGHSFKGQRGGFFSGPNGEHHGWLNNPSSPMQNTPSSTSSDSSSSSSSSSSSTPSSSSSSTSSTPASGG